MSNRVRNWQKDKKSIIFLQIIRNFGFINLKIEGFFIIVTTNALSSLILLTNLLEYQEPHHHALILHKNRGLKENRWEAKKKNKKKAICILFCDIMTFISRGFKYDVCCYFSYFSFLSISIHSFIQERERDMRHCV